jgi:prolycopene isomerase
VTIADLVDVTLPADRTGVVGVLAALHPAERRAVERFLDLVHDVFEEWIAFTYLGGSQLGPDEAKKKYPLFTHYALRTLREVLDELFVSQTLKTVLAAYWDYLGQTPAKHPARQGGCCMIPSSSAIRFPAPCCRV